MQKLKIAKRSLATLQSRAVQAAYSYGDFLGVTPKAADWQERAENVAERMGWWLVKRLLSAKELRRGKSLLAVEAESYASIPELIVERKTVIQEENTANIPVGAPRYVSSPLELRVGTRGLTAATHLGTFGPKKILSTPVKDIGEINIWESQRSFCAQRAKKMAKEKQATLEVIGGFPGVITVVEAENGDIDCVDGQHRLAAIKELAKKGVVDENFEIIVELYQEAGAGQKSGSSSKGGKSLAEIVFTEINKAEPVRLSALPGMLAADEKKVLDEGVDLIASKYQAMFKPTSRCRPPHLHKESFRELMFEVGVISRSNLKCGEDFAEWIESRNTALSQWTDARWKELRGRHSAKALEKSLAKARAHNFFLGLPGASRILQDSEL